MAVPIDDPRRFVVVAERDRWCYKVQLRLSRIFFIAERGRVLSLVLCDVLHTMRRSGATVHGREVPHDDRPNEESPVPVRTSGRGSDNTPRPVLRSEDLLGRGGEVAIRHGSEIYRLRRTRSGKLILTK
jgi:hemin uptake protein HemP